MMIIIKEAYLRDILVLKFPPSSQLICHSFSSAGEFGYISPEMFHQGGADKVNSLCMHAHTISLQKQSQQEGGEGWLLSDL